MKRILGFFLAGLLAASASAQTINSNVFLPGGGAGGGGTITGGGTPGAIPIWSGATALGDSQISQTVSTITIASRTLTVDSAGGTDAVYSESGVDRSSGSGTTFLITNSGAGSMTLTTDNLTVPGTTTFGGLAYSWPLVEGVNFCLTTNGSGVLSWSSCASGSITGSLVAGRVTLSAGASSVTDSANMTFSGSTLALGVAGAATGTMTLAGATSGVVTVNPAAAAGTWTLTLPTTDGNAGEFLQTNGSGVTTWAAAGGGSLTVGTTAIASGTAGRLLFEGTGNVLQENANLTWDNTNFILSATGAVRSGGSFAAPGFSFTADPDTGIVGGAFANIISFVTAGTEKIRIQASGNLSIGTTGDNGQLTINSTGSQNVITAIDDGTTVFTLENQGTARFAAASGIGADHVIIATGTLASTKRALNVTATLSTTAATQQALKYTITSAGSATGIGQDAASYLLAAGYTGNGRATGALFENAAAGTGTDAVSVDRGNYGAYAQAYATTTGTNVGTRGQASNGNINFGLDGIAIAAKNSATNVGVLGLGLNTGTSPVQVGGYFGLQATMPTFASAALLADNGSTTSPILLCRDNGSTTASCDDGGGFTITNGTLNSSSNASITLAPNGTGVLLISAQSFELDETTTTAPTCAADVDVGRQTLYSKSAGATISVCLCTKLASVYTLTALGTGDCT